MFKKSMRLLSKSILVLSILFISVVLHNKVQASTDFSKTYNKNIELFKLLATIDSIESDYNLPDNIKNTCNLVVLDTFSNRIKIIEDRSELIDEYNIVGYIYDNILYTEYYTKFNNLKVKYGDYDSYITYIRKLMSDYYDLHVFQTFSIFFMFLLVSLVIGNALDGFLTKFIGTLGSFVIFILISLCFSRDILYIVDVTNYNKIEKQIKYIGVYNKYETESEVYKKYQIEITEDDIATDIDTFITQLKGID